MGKKPTALGAYIFAGGFTIGVQKHFDVLTHFEDGPYGVETATRNGLIKEAHIDPATWPVSTYKNKVDFIYGNPPCAPWSSCSVGRAVPWQQDPRTNATRRLAALLTELNPTVWAWESVRPTFVKGRELVDAVAAAGNAAGYHATVLMVEGSRHGLPQKRARMFVVLSKVELPWAQTNQRRTVTVGDTLKTKFKTTTVSDTPDMYLKLLKKAEPGERLAKVYNRLFADRVEARGIGERMRGRPSFQNVRLVADRLSRVITGGAKQFHPRENRLISVEESAALCGYPRGFKFYGSTGKQYAQVAQAVMPPVGEYLARIVAVGIAARKRVRKPGYERVEVWTDHVDRAALTPGEVGSHALKPTPADTGRVFDRPKPVRAGAPATRSATLRAPGRGSGFRIREMLIKGWRPDKIVERIHKEFPGSKATVADVSWNARKLAQQGGRP